jgi:hypothetical protein
MNVYMASTLADDELPTAGDEVPFTTLTSAKECLERIYRMSLGSQDLRDGFGVTLTWQQDTGLPPGHCATGQPGAAGEPGEEFLELTDTAGGVERRTGFYVRTVRVFATVQEFLDAVPSGPEADQ